MRRPANFPWRSTSVNHRRRVGCSSARGRRRKWKNCRRPCSSTGSRASATHRASPSPPARTMVSDTAAPSRPHGALHSWADWVGLMKTFTTLPLCTQIWACLMTVPCQMWWPWMMVSKESFYIYISFEDHQKYESSGGSRHHISLSRAVLLRRGLIQPPFTSSVGHLLLRPPSASNPPSVIPAFIKAAQCGVWALPHSELSMERVQPGSALPKDH